ncbi:conserved hypothetical protein [Hyphomonas neptunium ATCC 15444]|uniref:DUF1330 domain-containing protein n=2 Tax=Hyphomonas TaxID=85 RepID=Q0C268_HYPNA|nr:MULTISPECIES: DUF1330 domain-containing protein [Hyphomonas]ABI75410.1 conserved hypothetical protein [Hyphomonas neptunium ATCC 15444]KCZ93113.1 hypothetical protein HHI_10529 [Hyphomonas hirschiana VP5]
MTVYALAQLKIEDRAVYQRYVDRFLPVLAAYGGCLLAADETPEQIEGVWPFDKVILIAFPDRDSFRRWANSEDYKAIAQDRLTSASGPVLLVQGL